MRLISTNTELERTLRRLTSYRSDSAFAVAWASSHTRLFAEILANRSRISRAVVGTHFYQTDPGVLDAFVGAPNVRFITQPSGVFHPKVFAFWSASGWDVIVGSANLTAGALTTNAEAVLLVSGKAGDDDSLLTEVRTLIDGYWARAEQMDDEGAAAYRRIWQQQQQSLRRLSAVYGKKAPSKPPLASSVMGMSWEQFFDRVTKDRHHGFQERCALLESVRLAFRQHQLFAQMPEGTRKTVAGIPGADDDRWPWFGSMKGAGYFKQAIGTNNPDLGGAVDAIPLVGQVSRSEYDAFIGGFGQAFPKGGDGVAVASRLLALKRPDQFVCLDSKNCRSLCADFGITAAGMDYPRYWDDVIERVRDTPWWNAPRPTDPVQQGVFDGRVAMLDAIFYLE